MASIIYIESDLPAEMTLIEWRRTRVAVARPKPRLRRLLPRRGA